MAVPLHMVATTGRSSSNMQLLSSNSQCANPVAVTADQGSHDIEDQVEVLGHHKEVLAEPAVHENPAHDIQDVVRPEDAVRADNYI